LLCPVRHNDSHNIPVFMTTIQESKIIEKSFFIFIYESDSSPELDSGSE